MSMVLKHVKSNVYDISNVEHVNYGHDEPSCELYGNSPFYRNQCIIIPFQCMSHDLH